MSIQSVTLKNYRSFVERTTIELRPLTLLYGYNNSGKSALLRALPLIADSLPVSTFMASEFSNSSHRRFKPPLALDSPAVKGSSFTDLLSRISGSQEFEIELSLNDYLLKWTLRDEPQLRTHSVLKFEMWLKEEKKVDYKLLFDSMATGVITGVNYVDRLQNDKPLIEHFQGLIPPGLMSEKVFNSLFFQLADSFATPLQWLSSVRSSPLRFNRFQGAVLDRLKPGGEGTAAILADDNVTGSNVLFLKVSGWYEKHFGHKIVVVEENREFFQIMLQPVNAPYKVNIVDTGEGLIQVLPVLVAGAMAKAGSILAIEEPESHLQPRYHAALAEYFCELANQKKPPKVLLETHSENFLLRIQLAIAKGELDPRSVIMYWVHRLEDGRSIAEPVTFDGFARPQGEWPRDVFYTDTELSKQLVQARRERSSL